MYRVKLVDLDDLERARGRAPVRDAHRVERHAAKAGVPRVHEVGVADARAAEDNGAHLPARRIKRKASMK